MLVFLYHRIFFNLKFFWNFLLRHYRDDPVFIIILYKTDCIKKSKQIFFDLINRLLDKPNKLFYTLFFLFTLTICRCSEWKCKQVQKVQWRIQSRMRLAVHTKCVWVRAVDDRHRTGVGIKCSLHCGNNRQYGRLAWRMVSYLSARNIKYPLFNTNFLN